VLAHVVSTGLVPADAPFVALQLSYQRIVWLADRPAPRDRGGASYAQARAPPTRS
jgi:hypothetical protein